jgi:hypothetical protein
MPRNIFRGCETYLEAGGHQVSTLLCNNVSRTTGGGVNKVWNFRQIRACYVVGRLLTVAVLRDTTKILSVLWNATVTYVNDSCLILKKIKSVSYETKWWNRKTRLALKLILTVLFSIQTITFAQGGACVS